MERSQSGEGSAPRHRPAAGLAGADRGRLRRGLTRLAGGDPAAFGAAFAALVVAALAGIAAGLILASATGALEKLPGLLLLVPAAIALRGNIFGALGSRLGTAIHTGTFRLTPRLDSVVGQNVAAAMALSLMMGVALAALAKAMAVAFNLSPAMSLADFVTVSTVGGLLASAAVLVITLVVTGAAVRFGLDLDNVAVPLVSATADVVTLPALVMAAGLAGVPTVTPVLAWSLAGLAALARPVGGAHPAGGPAPGGVGVGPGPGGGRAAGPRGGRHHGEAPGHLPGLPGAAGAAARLPGHGRRPGRRAVEPPVHQAPPGPHPPPPGALRPGPGRHRRRLRPVGPGVRGARPHGRGGGRRHRPGRPRAGRPGGRGRHRRA